MTRRHRVLMDIFREVSYHVFTDEKHWLTDLESDSSPIRYMSSSSAAPRTSGNRADVLRSESSGLFVHSTGVPAMQRRHDIESDIYASGGNRRRQIFVDANGMPVSDAPASDAATFSNMNPNTSEADAVGGQTQKYVWGSNVNIDDALNTVRDFYENFEKKYRMLADGEIESTQNLPADHLGREKEYMQTMETLLDLGVTSLNVDLRNLKAYPPAQKLWYQIQSFPAEIVPAFDVIFKDIMIDLAEKRMDEMRAQVRLEAMDVSRSRDANSIPPMPSSDIDNDRSRSDQPDIQALNDLPDLVREVNERVYKIRPFGLDQTINLRDLNPGDMDKVVSIKGLVIRTTPIIPDMRQGEQATRPQKQQDFADSIRSLFQMLGLQSLSQSRHRARQDHGANFVRQVRGGK